MHFRDAGSEVVNDSHVSTVGTGLDRHSILDHFGLSEWLMGCFEQFVPANQIPQITPLFFLQDGDRLREAKHRGLSAGVGQLTGAVHGEVGVLSI